MSKEQTQSNTPITAEEFLESSIAPDECRFGAEASDYCYTAEEVCWHMEAYKNKAVLEALEDKDNEIIAFAEWLTKKHTLNLITLLEHYREQK